MSIRNNILTMKKLLLILLCLPIIGFGQTSWTPCDSSFSISINSQDSIKVVYSVSGPNFNMNSNFSWVYFNMIGQCIGGSNSVASHIDTLNALNINNITDSTAIMCLISDSLSSCIVVDTLVYDSLSGWSLLSVQLSTSQTYVPDDNFEAYLEANGMGNGIANDDYVTTANINLITFLDVSNKNISDLTGIDEFTALEHLECWNNQISSLDVSGCTALEILLCDDNQIISLDISGTSSLTTLECPNNQLTSLDVSNNMALHYLWCSNNQLTSLNVSQNTALEALLCYNNQITSLDVSQNTALEGLLCYNNQLTCLDISNNDSLGALYCSNNLLEQLNTQNGNWANGLFVDADTNNLTCVEVDNIGYATSNWSNTFDNTVTFNTNCNYTSLCTTVSAIQEHSINKELLKVTDLLGRETNQTNQPLLYLYDDGTVEKKLIIE